ncbi:unnamed protein product [Sympodiomycopsis kandeliae]
MEVDTDVDVPTSPPDSPRQFVEISLSELPEVLAVASDSLDPSEDLSHWETILSTISSIKQLRSEERLGWQSKLESVANNLDALQSSTPRSTWKSESNHKSALTGYGVKTLDLVKSIGKLESSILRIEGQITDTRKRLEQISSQNDIRDGDESADDDSEEEDEVDEDEPGRNSLALTMFRQLGFQPLLPGSEASSISSIFARSDHKGKVTSFNVSHQDADLKAAAVRANLMWDAVD